MFIIFHGSVLFVVGTRSDFDLTRLQGELCRLQLHGSCSQRRCWWANFWQLFGEEIKVWRGQAEKHVLTQNTGPPSCVYFLVPAPDTSDQWDERTFSPHFVLLGLFFVVRRNWTKFVKLIHWLRAIKLWLWKHPQAQGLDVYCPNASWES